MLLYSTYIFSAIGLLFVFRCFVVYENQNMRFHNIITSNNVDKYMYDYYNAIRFYEFRYFSDIMRPKFPGAGRESGV